MQNFGKAVVAQPANGLKQGAMQMPPLEPSTNLVARVGPQSRHFFESLDIGIQWLNEPAATWKDIPAYQRFEKFARNLPVSNDAAERLVKRTTDYKDYGGRSEDDFQATLHVAAAAIQKVPDRSTKAALVKAYGEQR